MHNKFAALLSIGGAVAFLKIWYVFLFVAQPDGLSPLQAALQQATYALSQPDSERWFFILSLVSVVVCLCTAALLLFTKQTKVAMVIVAIHSIAAIFIYNWVLVMVIALPLLRYKKEGVNA